MSDEAIKSKGKLWKGFSATEWGMDLESFFAFIEKQLKDECFEAVLSGDQETAKQKGFELKGALMVREYINGLVEAFDELREADKLEKELESNVRRHI